MTLQTAQIGMNVVRSKGDYVVGRVGMIVELSADGTRARVQWAGHATTWVKIDVIEDAAMPYEIVTYGEWAMPKYVAI